MRPTTLDALRDAVATAASERAPLRVRGGGSKDFYGGMLAGQVLDTGGYCGVVAYEPTELYVTARCGTRLAEVESVLAERGQMLAFEPPAQFGCGLPENPGESVATVGGAVAAGLAGPRRQQVGGVRDFILGVKLVDGSGRVLEFGGQVMKNVAGYDVSRLMAGSMGTLGLIAEVTLKVLPRPQRADSPMMARSISSMRLWKRCWALAGVRAPSPYRCFCTRSAKRRRYSGCWQSRW